MSPKELLYIEDALGHEEFLKVQITQTASQLTDPELKNFVSSMMKDHNAIYKKIYGVL